MHKKLLKKNNRFSLFNFILLMLLLSLSKSALQFRPDDFNQNDFIWKEDYSNVNEGKRGFVFKYVMGILPYEDNRSGIAYQPSSSLCYKDDNDSIDPVFSTFTPIAPQSNMVTSGRVIIDPLTTNLPSIWETLCLAEMKDVNDYRMHIPLNFHADDRLSKYELKLRIANPTDDEATYHFLLYKEAIEDYLVPLPPELPPNPPNFLKRYHYRLKSDEIIAPHSVKYITKMIQIKDSNEVVIDGDDSKKDYYNDGPTQPGTSAYPPQPNLDIILSSNQPIGIATIELLYTRKTSEMTSYAGSTSCEDNRPCIENYSCGGFQCEKCIDPQCSKCDNGNGSMQCTQCHPTSIDWMQFNRPPNKCVFDFMDITKYNPITLSVPPALQWRATIEFWSFIHYPSNLSRPIVIIYKDFLSIALERVDATTIEVMCIPIEWLFKLDIKQSIKLQLTTNSIFHLIETQSRISSKWIYTRCAFNIDSNKSYLNNQYETDLKIPQMYANRNDFLWQFKKFYKKDALVSFSITNHEGLNSNVYFRNINVYREYIPQIIETKYFNMHKLTLHSAFPQLLFSIPLNDVSSSSLTGYEFKWFNYFDRSNTAAFANVKEEKGKASIYLAPGVELKDVSLVPGRNFKRINFLDVDTQYTDCEFKNVNSIICTGKQSHCFEDNKPFSCIEDHYLYPTDLSCNSYCPNGIMHFPDDTTYQRKGYCTAQCELNSQLCPSSQDHYQTIKVFQCKAPSFTSYYKCINEEDHCNKGNALHFSSALNSHSIEIELNQAYNSFVLEAWIYSDIRFPYVGSDRVVFMTDLFKVINYVGKPYYNSIAVVREEIIESGDAFASVGWMHFMFSSDLVGGSTEYYYSYRHNLYANEKNHQSNVSYRGATWITGTGSMKKIYFCQNESGICDVQWINAYYKDIRVWDITHSSRYAVFNAFQYESTGSVMLKHNFRMHLEDITANEVVDQLSSSKGFVPINMDGTNQNPDNHNLLNYACNFSYEELEGGFISSYNTIGYSVTVNKQSCAEGCALCFNNSNNNCLKCTDGFALYGNKCYKSSYVYKNPGLNMPDKISLDIKAKDIESKPYITLFFFIKLYGFNKEFTPSGQEQTLIIFDLSRQFYLKYNPDVLNGSLEIIFNNVVHYRYGEFRNDFFGHWVPISIATFREYDVTFTQSMTQASILYKNLPLISGMPMRTFTFTEFTLTNTWIGLLSDVKIYNYFIINAWGLVKHDSLETINKYLLMEIPLKSDNKNQCLQNEQIINASNDLNIECYADYNPHWIKCGNNNYIHWDQAHVIGACGGQCGSYGDLSFCLGNDASYPLTDSSLHSCINQDLKWSNYRPLLNGNTLMCSSFTLLDFARFKKGQVAVHSPPAVFAIDFWFYSQSFVGNNFDSITFIWDFHIKVTVSFSKAKNTFVAVCYPAINSNEPDENQGSMELILGNRPNTWIYISCGVHHESKLFYLSNMNKFMNENPYVSNTIIPLNPRTTFSFEETSRNGYGITYINELRLWKCYSCSVAFRNFLYQKGHYNFNDVLHCWKNGSTKGVFNDETGDATTIVIDEVADFKGYNILTKGIGGIVYCNEDNDNYYQDSNKNCNTMYNLARLNDFQVLVPSSRTNRYSMGFWFYIERASEFTNGMNIYWENHMSLSIVRDSAQPEMIVALCFPQAYRDVIDGKIGLEMFELYNTAINKEQYSFYDSSSKWLFVRCAVDMTRNLMYINDNPEIAIIGESLYSSTNNIRPFRFFTILKTSAIKFQNANKNKTRIFFRSFRAYRDYIDYRIDDIKYIDMGKYIKKFTPLGLYIDFIERGSNCAGIIYSTYDSEQSLTDTCLSTFFSGKQSIYYTTYPIFYIQYFCSGGENGGNDKICTGTICEFCYYNSSTKFFYSTSGYVNINTLAKEPSCENALHTRLPDSDTNCGFCLLDCQKEGIDTCALKSPDLGSIENYKKEFTCLEGYSKVYYDCIKNDLVKDSAMYFSNYYSFNNVLVNIYPITKTKSYYLEFWIKLDPINFNEAITEKLHYLLAPPHMIIQDPVDQKFKYANYKISNGAKLFPLAAMSEFEWNRFIIETRYDDVASLVHIFLYLNYDFVNPEVSLLHLDGTVYDMTFQGLGFCDQPFATCIINKNTYNPSWGTAWYRNIRLWNEKATSLQLIQSCEFKYGELLKAQLYYYPFTIDYIDHSKLVDRISPLSNFMNGKFWYFKNVYDDDIRQNYSVNTFDYSSLNPGFYIGGLDDTGKGYRLIQCAPACKRCYSASSANCYECNHSYSLIGKECKADTFNYFKTPTANPAIDEIELLTTMQNPIEFDITKQNPLTMTLWIKFLGISLNALSGPHYPLVYFYDTVSYFEYDSDLAVFALIVEGQVAFRIEIKTYIAKWTHIGLSIHHSATKDLTTFPHMVNLMIDQKIILPLNTFDPETMPVKVNRFSISNLPLAYYSELSFYSNYWFGTYGHVTASSTSKDKDLIYKVNLYGTGIDTCILDGQLKDINVSIVQPICISDYNPFSDKANKCATDAFYLDLSLETVPPCDSCSSLCVTQCFNKSDQSCSCNYKEGLYWIATQTPIESYHCQKVTNINFAFYEAITVQYLKMVSNEEMSLEFWLYVYSYNADMFRSIDIIWDKHVRVTIENRIGSLYSDCYPYTNIDDLASDAEAMSDTIPNTPSWIYIRCAANRYSKKYYVNQQLDQSYSVDTSIPPSQTYSSLMIRDNMDNAINWNYGFSFIRELKLFSSYNYRFWLPKEHNLTPNNYQYLLHYFKNTFDQSDLTKAKLYDEVDAFSSLLQLRNKLIGYNYVKEYTDIILCDEDYVWYDDTQSCKLFNTEKCKYSRVKEGKCLICSSLFPYLKDDDECYADCLEHYYPDDYLSQCRPCDDSCLTCNGKYVNNCLSCEGLLFLVPHLNLCVPDCEMYSLTASIDPPNTCVSFATKARVIKPDISVPTDLANFNEIIGEVYDSTSPGYSTEWQFDRIETINANSNHRDPNGLMLPIGEPFTSLTNALLVQIDNTFFKHGYQYVFHLIISKSQNGFLTSVDIPFTFTFNDYPLIGIINVLPSQGYISYTFLFTCNQCSDDNTINEELEYKFTINPNANDDSSEVTIQDYKQNSELLFKFDSVSSSNDYYITCYCKDKMSIFNSTTSSIKVYLPPNESNVVLPLIDIIETIDINDFLNSEQLYKRAMFLYSLTIDFPKTPVVNRITVTANGSTILLNEPQSNIKDSYCNKRGASYVIDKFLYCDCQNFKGKNCQIDIASYQKLVDIYSLLYTKLKEVQSTTFDIYILKGIHLLITSGALFLESKQMSFFFQAIDYCVLCTQNFPLEMKKDSNENLYLDIYHSLMEYGLAQVNRFKMQNFIDSNSRLPSGLYDQDLIRNQTLIGNQIETMRQYFNRLKTDLYTIIKFYKDNKYPIAYVNAHLNIYITLINENFSFESFFSLERRTYQPHFDASNCLGNVMKKYSSGGAYKLILVSTIWKSSPYLYSDELYANNTSPVIEIDFYDQESLKQIVLSECGDDHNIDIYFPIDSYTIPERVNAMRNLVSPENQYDVGHDIFNDPVYINDKGEVFSTTPPERIEGFFLPFNFSCAFYTLNEDSLISNYSMAGCDYSKYTDDNFIQCKCSHLTDFVVNKYEVSGEFTINTRFFYLKHYMLFAFNGNYILNPVFYVFVCLALLYFGVILSYLICECYIVRKLSLLSYLTKSIIRLNLPYQDEADYTDDLKLTPEAKKRLDGERDRNMEPIENDVGINNVDVMILADNLAQYQRGYDDKNKDKDKKAENADFFSQSKPEIIDSGARFFNNKRLEIKNKDDSKKFLHNKNKTEYSKKFFTKDNDNENEGDNSIKENNSNANLNGNDKSYNNSNHNKEDCDKEIINKNSKEKNGSFFTKEINNSKNINRKEVIPFQENFSHYNPTFSQPKIISSKLHFYAKDAILAEEADIRRIDKQTTGISNNFITKTEKKNKEPEIKVEVTENDLILSSLTARKQKDELPKLALELTKEQRLWEFDNINLESCSFLQKNISNRYILSITFAKFSIAYGRYKRIGNFMSQLALYLFILSLLFTSDYRMDVLNGRSPYSVSMFIVYCLIAEIASCLLIHLPSYCFYVDVQHFRVVYETIRSNGGLEIIKQWEMMNKGKKMWTVAGIAIQWVYVLVSVYFSFGFCATYVDQASTFFLAFVATILVDWLVMEFVWELFIALLYKVRSNGKATIRLGYFLNKTRTMKTLT